MRKAVGARRRESVTQFLIEAATLTGMAGLGIASAGLAMLIVGIPTSSRSGLPGGFVVSSRSASASTWPAEGRAPKPHRRLRYGRGRRKRGPSSRGGDSPKPPRRFECCILPKARALISDSRRGTRLKKATKSSGARSQHPRKRAFRKAAAKSSGAAAATAKTVGWRGECSTTRAVEKCCGRHVEGGRRQEAQRENGAVRLEISSERETPSFRRPRAAPFARTSSKPANGNGEEKNASPQRAGAYRDQPPPVEQFYVTPAAEAAMHAVDPIRGSAPQYRLRVMTSGFHKDDIDLHPLRELHTSTPARPLNNIVALSLRCRSFGGVKSHTSSRRCRDVDISTSKRIALHRAS